MTVSKIWLKCRLDSLQAQIDALVDEDDQQLTLVGNTLVLEDGGVVDLSPFLDDTDNQTITNFSLAGTVVTLTIDDGNTVVLDLASLDTDTDDQTLALAGNILTIVDGNSIDLSQFEETLATTSATVYVEEFAGGSTDGLNTGAWGRNAAVNRLSAGRWNVTFASAHPDGDEYHVSFSAEEPNTDRDNPKMTIEQGTKTATGFILMLTVDDNGTGADGYSDQPWTFGVSVPVSVIDSAVLS